MEESRPVTPAQPSRPPSSMEILLEAIQTNAKSTHEAIQTNAKSTHEAIQSHARSSQEAMQMHARDTQEAIATVEFNVLAVQSNVSDAISSVQSNVREEISAVRDNVREALTEVVSRLERLETSPVPKPAVDVNPGLKSTAITTADASYHSTIGLEETLGARPKDFAHPGILRRSDRLASRPPIAYREFGSRNNWPPFHRWDSNPEVTSSCPPSISRARLQQHAAISSEDPEVATPGRPIGVGVTI